MNFNKHFSLEGRHAIFSPSQPAWLNYSDEQIGISYENRKAADLGTQLHAWAKTTIDLGIKQPRSAKTLYLYVNDAIGFKMQTEVLLYYSNYIFGTADAISFRNNVLRIHDLKTGKSPVHIEQVRIYAALFCLEYGYKPYDIEIHLRIYQSNQVLTDDPDPSEIEDIMEKIKHLDMILKYIDK